jgi:hypothetical protein
MAASIKAGLSPRVLSMTAMTLRKGVAAFCCVLGTVLGLVGAYYLWNSPIETGGLGVMLILAGFLLHAIFWVLWS